MTPASTGLIAMGSMVAFTLIVAGIFVFSIFPTLLEVGEAILKARNDASQDLFP